MKDNQLTQWTRSSTPDFIAPTISFFIEGRLFLKKAPTSTHQSIIWSFWGGCLQSTAREEQMCSWTGISYTQPLTSCLQRVSRGGDNKLIGSAWTRSVRLIAFAIWMPTHIIVPTTTFSISSFGIQLKDLHQFGVYIFLNYFIVIILVNFPVIISNELTCPFRQGPLLPNWKHCCVSKWKFARDSAQRQWVRSAVWLYANKRPDSQGPRVWCS